MGIVRHLVVATTAAVLLVLDGGGAFAQAGDQRLIDELVHKAEQREPADGFCARTNWPPGDSQEGFAKFLRGAVVGTSIVRTFVSGSCVLNRTTEVHKEKGGKCVGYTFYVCPKDGNCGVGQSIDCLDRNGRYVSRREP
jgi:hypothetical protein